MSFAAEVRRELSEHISRSKHCQKAELRGIFEGSHHELPFSIFSEGLTIPQKCISLVKKAYGLEPLTERVDHQIRVSLNPGGSKVYKDLMDEKVLARECCKRAYLRGWFLAAGTVTDPEGHYHLEIRTMTTEQASYIIEILRSFDLDAKYTSRKGRYIVYLKEGQKVVDFLNIVGAHVAMMGFENARIVKEVCGRVNRQVNCETANIKKTISASARQVSDIKYIDEVLGFDQLSEGLRQMAITRLENPEVSLKELGDMMGLGKSAVNHRLRRLESLAEELRDGGSKDDQ